MKTIKLLLFLPLLTSAYNLSPNHSIVYSAASTQKGENQADTSYFGYNVILHNSKITNESWIIVGAPKANYTKHTEDGNEIPVEPGLAYRCSISTGSCESIDVRNPDDEGGFIEQVQRNILIQKEHGWFGAAISLHESTSLLAICAPRTTVRIYNTLADHYQVTMHGVCYKEDLSPGGLHIEDKNFSTYDFTSGSWYNPMNGFAVHYPTSKVEAKIDEIRPVVGSPKHETCGTVHVIGQKKPAELPISDDLTQFGYSLSSGYYFHEEQLMISGAAPGWQYVGQVAIMEPRSDPVSIIATVEGKEVGEYFGASLATGDLNNDGLDDLIVGAPHWKNDDGRVHIFFGNQAGFFEADLFLEGSVDDGLFGYAVTSGDIDGDGFDDIIIGAPWEESGVIYVYNGDSKLTSDKDREVILLKPSQRIAASSIRDDLLRFGFSLSKPVDVDGNGFLDVGVGAYASGHAVVLLSRPVIRTEMTITTIPATLPRNATSFEMEMCVRHFENNKILMRDFYFIQIFDEDYKRVARPKSAWMVRDTRREVERCIANRTFNLVEGIRNYVDPINIVIIHKFETGSREYNWVDKYVGNCTLCPIEYKGLPSAIFRAKLPFDIGCGMDHICQAFIAATLEFQDVKNSTWIIGSGDLRLILLVGNHEEPAYLTTVTFEIPEKISLRSILPSCQEERDRKILRVSCDVGNPLATNSEKRISLDLDMSRIHNASADGTELIFLVEIKTRSVNRGVKKISLSLHPKANVSVALSGKAYDDRYYFNYNEKPTNVTLQHTYQISRFGETPISETRLTIRVPYKIDDLEFLTILHRPRVSVLGRSYECSVANVSVSKPRISLEKKIDNEFQLGSVANHSRNRRRSSEDDRANADEGLSNSNDSESNVDTASELYAMPDSSNADIVYLQCSTPNITCGQVVCNIPSLKTSQDVMKLQLQLSIDNGKIIDASTSREKIVHFATDARVDVSNSAMHFSIPGTGLVVSVTTKFHRAPSTTSEISIWIILGSVLLGLLALCLLAVALRKIGFFKRDEKDKLETLKSTEAVPLDSEDIFI